MNRRGARKLSPVEHYLITIDLCPLPARMHSYVMTNDESCLQGIWQQMFEVAEKEGFKIMLPMILQTKLGSAADIVRRIVGDKSPEAKTLFDTATDFHCSTFVLGTHDPDDPVLMELH